MLFKNILETVGQTPLIRLNRIGRDLPARLYVKCEFFNPGGSVKDRIAFRMLQKAQEKGLIQRGDTLIEPTSGNTGIGLALAGAVMGYKVIIVMPDKMSTEKESILKTLGAEIIRTKAELGYADPESHISKAKSLQRQIPRAHILDQYSNPENFRAHAEGTAEEILKDLKGSLDMLVAGAGTGGTLTGLAKRIKQDLPHCEIIGVDPKGSILAGKEPIRPYKVEGIGYDFIPKVLDRSLISRWVKTEDGESFAMARRLIREEGLLCGGSSGAAVCASLKEASKLKKGQNCVIILPDGIRNYMSKLASDQWMRENNFPF